MSDDRFHKCVKFTPIRRDPERLRYLAERLDLSLAEVLREALEVLEKSERRKEAAEAKRREEAAA